MSASQHQLYQALRNPNAKRYPNYDVKTAEELIADIGNKMADAMNCLAALSRVVRDLEPEPAPVVLPQRRRATPVAVPSPPQTPAQMYRNGVQTLRNAVPPQRFHAAPVQQQPVRRTRRQGAAERIVAALLSPTGVLASQLREIAGYPAGPTVLDRLAASHGFTWYETGTGDKRRYIGNKAPPPRRR